MILPHPSLSKNFIFTEQKLKQKQPGGLDDQSNSSNSEFQIFSFSKWFADSREMKHFAKHSQRSNSEAHLFTRIDCSFSNDTKY